MFDIVDEGDGDEENVEEGFIDCGNFFQVKFIKDLYFSQLTYYYVWKLLIIHLTIKTFC